MPSPVVVKLWLQSLVDRLRSVFPATANSESQIKSGALRIIGISSDAKVEGIDAPTFKEGGVDVAIQNWRMIAAAPGITPEQEAAISADIEKLVKSKSWQEQLKAKGWADTYLAGDAFKAQLAKDTEATSAILKDIGLVK